MKLLPKLADFQSFGDALPETIELGNDSRWSVRKLSGRLRGGGHIVDQRL
jgi:hypothetical protein